MTSITWRDNWTIRWHLQIQRGILGYWFKAWLACWENVGIRKLTLSEQLAFTNETYWTSQGLKPVYELFLERRVKEVTSQAVSAATGISRENVETAMGAMSRQNSTTPAKKRHVANGKPKHSWEYASAVVCDDGSPNTGLSSFFINIFNKFTTTSESTGPQNQQNVAQLKNSVKGGTSKRRKSRKKI